MSKEVTARIKSTPEIVQKIKELAVTTTELPKIPTSSFWKPKGVELKDFSPRDKALRLRTYEDGKSQAIKADMIREGETYTHTKEKIKEGTEEECRQALVDLGYEPWIEYSQSAIEYVLVDIDGQSFSVLEETFNDVSETLKFEAENEGSIWAFLAQFGLGKDDVTSKNTAEILAEKADLL